MWQVSQSERVLDGAWHVVQFATPGTLMSVASLLVRVDA
jgi:hypothetical protein